MKPNNFDLIRLVLASLVVLFHCYALSDSPALRIFGWIGGRIAVEGFFVISGFLIFASYERSKSLRDYCLKRARRILPGYWLSTLLCVVIALSFSRSLDILKFLAANLTFLNFLHPGVSGVFQENPSNAAINGSLWTIKVELMFYASVPIIVWFCRRFGKLRVLAACTFASLLYVHASVGPAKWLVQLPGQLSFFSLGALGYYYLPQFKRWGRWLIVPATGILVLQWITGWFFLRPFSIATFVLGASLLLPAIKGPTRWGDFSYGTYVLHYPVIQTLVAWGMFARAPWLATMSVLITVFTSAVFSWYFVERRWITRRSLPMTAAANQPMEHAVV